MFDLKRYSSNIQMILGPHEGGKRLMPLAPAEPLQGPGLALLTAASARQLLADEKIASQEFVKCVRSALFLYFSDLKASHEISQSIHSSTGSFLHGIMHRQEPDFGNAKYWFRRVVDHDVYKELREASLAMLKAQSTPAATLLAGEIESASRWDSQWLIDQCEAAQGGNNVDFEQRLLEIQSLEWQLLFDYCYRKATGQH
jgi:hypothetical protein